MLLRSSSTPILKSCIQNHQPTLSPEPDLGLRIQTIQKTRRRSLSLKNLVNMPRTSSEGDLKQLVLKKKTMSPKNSLIVHSLLLAEQGEKQKGGKMMDRVSFFGGGKVGVVEEEKVSLGGGAGRGGGIYGGRGGGGGSDGEGEGDGGKGSENMDGYYQKMISEFPNDALLLGNYAKYLKEVRGNAVKAEEYCERAILAKASDAEVLSMYGDLIWNNHKDASRAQSYFNQALESSPDDCYILASYARFLGDAGEEEDDDDEQIHASDYESRFDFSSKGFPSATLAATS